MFRKTKEEIRKLFVEQCSITALNPSKSGTTSFKITSEYINFTNNVYATLQREKGLIKQLRDIDISSILMEYFFKVLPGPDKSIWGKKISDVVGDKVETIATELIEYLESIPRKYKVLFYLPVFAPKEFTNVQIAKGISLVRHTNEKTPGFFATDKPNGIYLEISTSGYASYDIDTDALSTAYTKFKLFLLYGLLQKIFIKEYKSDQSLFGFNTINPNRSYLIENKTEQSFSLPDAAQKYISRLAFNEEMLAKKTKLPPDSGLLGKPIPMKFEEVIQDAFKLFTRFIEIHSKRPEDALYITTASDWAFEARTHENESHRLILGCIAIEALIGEDAKSNKTEILANRCASILGRTRKDRAQVCKMFREAYNARSDLVHGSTTRLNDDQRKYLTFFEGTFDSIFLKELIAFN